MPRACGTYPCGAVATGLASELSDGLKWLMPEAAPPKVRGSLKELVPGSVWKLVRSGSSVWKLALECAEKESAAGSVLKLALSGTSVLKLSLLGGSVAKLALSGTIVAKLVLSGAPLCASKFVRVVGMFPFAAAGAAGASCGCATVPAKLAVSRGSMPLVSAGGQHQSQQQHARPIRPVPSFW
eukprot:CAMPEP_0171103076 /NCGR_PEP_ID=MMETSP0766_2-20121228/58721_1 /TAXON_ID=439317 /ORGANISM="Gambierdiscus australes, Strain CAWD 149" /LENGTH=182 /DNA_ID=CAMNT_0011563475 /DNA_START=180 /DNA_END=725 /DNA_ORIENTATION=-